MDAAALDVFGEERRVLEAVDPEAGKGLGLAGDERSDGSIDARVGGLAAAGCDIWVEQPCGLKAICGKCRVRVGEGLAQVSPADLRLLTREEIAAGWRLACQLVLDGPAVVEIPEITRSAAAKPFARVVT